MEEALTINNKLFEKVKRLEHQVRELAGQLDKYRGVFSGTSSVISSM